MNILKDLSEIFKLLILLTWSTVCVIRVYKAYKNKTYILPIFCVIIWIGLVYSFYFAFIPGKPQKLISRQESIYVNKKPVYREKDKALKEVERPFGDIDDYINSFKKGK